MMLICPHEIMPAAEVDFANKLIGGGVLGRVRLLARSLIIS
jgi:hypothetical protein